VESGVWLAEVDDLNTRQLYVNGLRAERAGIDGLPGRVTVTETGYVIDSTEPCRGVARVTWSSCIGASTRGRRLAAALPRSQPATAAP
jgi:hypothetical protein